MQVLSKKKSIKDFQPKPKILAPGEYEVVDPGRLVRIGNRQFQFVRGETWLFDATMVTNYWVSISFIQIEPGIRITQFNNDGTIDYIHFITNSEYETQQTLRNENETHICSFDCSCNSDLPEHDRDMLFSLRDQTELYHFGQKTIPVRIAPISKIE